MILQNNFLQFVNWFCTDFNHVYYCLIHFYYCECFKFDQFSPIGWRKLNHFVRFPYSQTFKKPQWVQLGGHRGNFEAGHEKGTVLKKYPVKEEECFIDLMNDIMKPYVPEYKGVVIKNNGQVLFIQLQDLLCNFVNPCVMDCKIGVRTYLEEELTQNEMKSKLRKDMYNKMIEIDSNVATAKENILKAVTKPRYMMWRETISSTASLGFRIEALCKPNGITINNFKTTKTRDQVMKVFYEFIEGFPHALPQYINRLKEMKENLQFSNFFNTHEVIGSSLLFIHDHDHANVWLIDFAKANLLPSNISIDHNSVWKIGNHEDGFMIGINNIINIFEAMESP